MAQFWKQLLNNPKSISSDSLPSPSDPNLNKNNHINSMNVTSSLSDRPILSNRAYSYNTPSTTFKNKSPNNNKNNNNNHINNSNLSSNSTSYKDYRDKFLSDRNGFTGRVFGVSLAESLSVASAEVIVQSELVSFGRVPILAAKCGAYLKANGLETQGIFRIAGNGKRVKELQFVFSSPPSYGAKFNNWEAYSVHDVASLLRRFLNNLEEPLVPLKFYNDFRKPIEERPRIIKHMSSRHIAHPNANKENNVTIESRSKEQNESKVNEQLEQKPKEDIKNKTEISSKEDSNLLCKGRKNDSYEADKENDADEERNNEEELEAEEIKRKKLRHKKRLTRDIKAAIKDYENLFLHLSNDSKQLTIYLVDLLSLFARQSQLNLMTARNLSAIFQPSILSHPQHDMDPKEYELSRYVVEFLIEYSYKLLPNLLKTAKEEQESNILNAKNGMSAPISAPKIVIPSNEESMKRTIEIKRSGSFQNSANSQVETTLSGSGSGTPGAIDIPHRLSNTKTSSNLSSSSIINRSSEQQVQEAQDLGMSLKLQVPQRISRPHSKSIGSATVPPDVISSNKRRTKLFPWLHKPGILSDTGEISATEGEGEDLVLSNDEEVITQKNILTNKKSNISIKISNSHVGNYSPTNTSSLLKVPDIVSRPSRTNSNSSGRIRPVSMFPDSFKSRSVDELAHTSNTKTVSNKSNEKDSRLSRSKKRESWFHRWTSRSSSASRT